MKRTNQTDYENKRPVKAWWIILTVIALAVAVGVGVYGLFFKPNVQTEPTVAPSITVPSATTPPTSRPTPNTKDPEVFARWAAATLFGWNTATMNPSTVTDTLMAVADPLGEESAGLASDITNYLPDTQTWAKLRGYATRQWLDIDTTVIPEAWKQAETGAAPGQILPGTVAYTITGTQHREGTWQDQPTTYAETASFTVFVTCAPSFPECHLMRLSLPGQPLK